MFRGAHLKKVRVSITREMLDKIVFLANTRNAKILKISEMKNTKIRMDFVGEKTEPKFYLSYTQMFMDIFYRYNLKRVWDLDVSKKHDSVKP